MLKHDIPEHHPAIRRRTGQLVADFDVFTANITEKFLDITAYQLAEGESRPPRPRIERLRPAKVWPLASITASNSTTAPAVSTSSRCTIRRSSRAKWPNFGAIVRSIDYFGEMLRTLQFTESTAS